MRKEEEYFNDGCGVSCIAKVTGLSRSKVRAMASDNYIHQWEVVAILKKLGYKVKTPFRPSLFLGKKYIAIVPSVRTRAEFHFVVLYLKKYKNRTVVHIYDPAATPEKPHYVSQHKKTLKKNEIRLKSWTAIIEINNPS